MQTKGREGQKRKNLPDVIDETPQTVVYFLSAGLDEINGLLNDATHPSQIIVCTMQYTQFLCSIHIKRATVIMADCLFSRLSTAYDY